MEVDRAVVDGRERPRGLDRADQLARGHVDDRERVHPRRAQRHVGRRVVLGASRHERPSGRTRRCPAVTSLPLPLPSGPSDAPSAASSGPSCAAHSRCPAWICSFVVEDRGLDRAVEERIRMAAEELIQGVLAGHVHREAAPAAPRPAPHLAQRGDGPREGDEDRRVQRADVDPQLQRVRGHHAEQLALDQPPLELAPLLRRVAGAVGRDPRADRRGQGPPGHRVNLAISSTARRDFMKQIVRAPSLTSSAIRSEASASTDRRAASGSSHAAGSTSRSCFAAGEPSVGDVMSSRPVRRSASSTGLAIVADAIRNRGAVP